MFYTVMPILATANPYVNFMIYTAIMAAVAYGASMLMKSKTPTSPLDDTHVDPSIRGSICKYVLGRRKITPVVGWVGNTVSRQVDAGGGGGKGGGGGGSAPQKTQYQQSGMHILCLGQGEELYGIWERGTLIYSATLDKTSHPSGSQISTPKGNFRIYWGEASQPVDAPLLEYTGNNISFNNVMYIMWDRKILGDAKIWPVLEYEIRVGPQFSTLFGKSVWLSSGGVESSHTVFVSNGSTDLADAEATTIEDGAVSNRIHFRTLDYSVLNLEPGRLLSVTHGGVTFESRVLRVGYDPISGYHATVQSTNPVPASFLGATGLTMNISKYTRQGLNVAAIIYQLLFGAFPYGLEYDISDYNLTDIEDVFDYFDDGQPFELPASVMMKDKRSIQDGLSMILQDCGIVLSWDIVTAKYKFQVIKDTDTPTSIASDNYRLDKKDDFSTKGYSVLEPQHRYYVFEDANRSFSQSSIMISDDGSSKYAKMPNAKSVPMFTITDLGTASKFAQRRDLEFYVRTGFKVLVASTEMDIVPGKLYALEGIAGTYRLTEKEVSTDKADFRCTFLQDLYSDSSEAYVTVPTGLNPEGESQAYHDIKFRLFEINKYFAYNIDGIFLFRIRGGGYNNNTALYLSPDGSTYTGVALTATYATGGILQENLSADTATIIETGPKVLFYGTDADYVKSYVSDEYDWKAGAQVAFINGEVFFVRNITPTLVDNEYTLDGLIRARKGTNVEAHAIDDEVYIMQGADLQVVLDPMIIADVTLSGKSVPYAGSDTVEIADVTAKTVDYTGGGHKPLPCVNLNTLESSKAWIAGEDIETVWGYRNIAGQAGAGLNLSDAPYSVPVPEGYFKLEFLDGVTLKRTVTSETPMYTYTNAMLVSDFAGEPSEINVNVYNVFGGHQSNVHSATFEKV